VPDADTLVLFIGPAAKAPSLKKGDAVKISTETEPPLRGVSDALSGGPILVMNGKRQKIKVPESDSYIFSSMQERHPRSAIGWNDEFYFLVAVDGRQRASLGMTLEEFGAQLVKLGCTHALNLDGGGSSTLWFEGKVRNFLCDGYERDIANSLVVVEKKPAAGK
jgi:exopolysaccharide biosynthesis protein